jgi:hypothetical protein
MIIYTEHLLKWRWSRETVRHFRSGGSSGTIAKAMSAYDKDFVISMELKKMDDM